MTTSTQPTLPPTLIPVKRGAVIDWRATAVTEHEDKWTFQVQSSNRQRIINEQATEITNLTGRLSIASKQAHDALNDLETIRNHWSAIFLPRALR